MTILTAEERWDRNAVVGYTLDLHFVTYGTEIYIHLRVVDEKVVEYTCRPGTMFDATDEHQCTSFLAMPEQYTVAGLFATAYRLNADFMPFAEGQSAGYAPELRFHPKLGYPIRLAWQLPEYTLWEVTSFTRL